MFIEPKRKPVSRFGQRGITLVEQIVFIVIVSVGVVGLVSVLGPMIRHSADPMVTKQMTAIAESLLNEVLHQPFTWCDPDDPKASTAISYSDCAKPQNTGTYTAGESRDGIAAETAFDNVDDYNGYTQNDATDPTGSNVMTGYKTSVAIARVGLSMGLGDDSAALRITVTVTRGGDAFSLTGYRFRYAPRI